MTIKQQGGVFGRNPTFNDVTIEGTLTFEGNIDIDSDITWEDNKKAIFGDDSDLQIYHDGSDSYVKDAGTGNLLIQAQNLSLEDSTGTRFFLGIQGGETRLYNQGDEKVAVTSTGIDVTGTVTANNVGIGCTDPSFRLEINDGSSSIISLTRDDPTIGSANSLGQIVFRSTEDSRSTINIGANIVGVSDAAHSTSSAPTAITFGTTPSGSTSPTERLRISSAGNVTVSTGNLVIGTSGQGIDFSATAGTGTSELFDDYEEGTWTPVLVGSTSAGTATPVSGPNGTYTKIGNQVTVYFDWNISAHTGTGALRVNGLPFAAGSITAIGAIMDGNYTYSAGRTKLVAYPVGSVLRIYQVGDGVGYIENVLDTSHQINGSVTYTV
jgi:hypothetical protein